MRSVLAFVALALTSQMVGAATLCGTVRDGATQAPIAQAGIFLYQNNLYTGLYGASDVDGGFCIDQIPNGIYDVQVRVDDYVDTWLHDVIIDQLVSVDLFPGGPVQLFAPYPNPTSDQINIGFRVREALPVTLEIFDLRGRRVHGWQGVAEPGDTTLRYGFVDRSGKRLASGLYFVRLQAAEQILTRRVQLVQ